MITPNNLKNTRISLGLSQNCVAISAGIYLRLYQYYEVGEKVPSVHTAIKLAKVLNTTVEELFPLSKVK